TFVSFVVNAFCRSAQHDPFNGTRFAAAFVTVDDHRAQTRVPGRGLKTHRHVVQEAVDDHFFFYPDHAIVGAGHAHIGDVGRPTGKYALIGGGDVRVGSDQGSHPAVEIPAERHFFRSRLGVQIHKNDFGLQLLQNVVGFAKGVIVRG